MNDYATVLASINLNARRLAILDMTRTRAICPNLAERIRYRANQDSLTVESADFIIDHLARYPLVEQVAR